MKETCHRPTLGGGFCEREPGHEGKHRLAMPSGHFFEWTDEGMDEQIRKHGSRFD